MRKMPGMTPEQTISVMTELVLPGQSNFLGNLLGGRLMHWMDIAGALTCRRHAGREVATVAVDKILFKRPAKVGEIITVTSKMIWVGHTSMKVHINVCEENTLSHKSKQTTTAYFTYVALDENGRPTEVPPLLPQTEKEKADFEEEQQKYLKMKKCGSDKV